MDNLIGYNTFLWIGLLTIIVCSALLLISGSNMRMKWILCWIMAVNSMGIGLSGYLLTGPLIVNSIGSSISVEIHSISFSIVAMVVLLLLSTVSGKLGTKMQVEEIIFWLFLTLGTILIYNSGDFVFFFAVMEGLTLFFYVMASLHKTNMEASIKYLIFSLLASLIFLIGVFIIYKNAGTLDFSEIRVLSSYQSNYSWGMTLIVMAILLKMGSAPFHLWMIEVYQKASDFAFSTFITFNKVIFTGLLIKLHYQVFPIYGQWLGFAGVTSIVIGLMGAVYYSRIKGFLAYSGLVNLGYLSLALATANIQVMVGVYFYILAYSVIMIGLLYFIYEPINKIKYSLIKYLNKIRGEVGVLICLSSLAGIPPLVGFMGKFLLLESLYFTHETVLLLIVLVAGVCTGFYYVRIIFISTTESWGNLYVVKPYSIIVIVLAAISPVLLFDYITKILELFNI